VRSLSVVRRPSALRRPSIARRLDDQSGIAMIMMLGIAATLAVLAATVVMVTANTQSSTADVRTQTTAFDYAEAGLSSGVLAVRTQAWPASGGAFSASSLAAAYNTTYPTGPTATIIVYDNQNPINKSITWDKGSPASASTPDGQLWVQSAVTFNGKTAVVRQEVGQVNASGTFQVPQAAIYTDGSVNFTGGGGNVFAVTASGAPDTSMSAAVKAGGNFVGNWSTSLSPTGGAPTVAIDTNGTVTNPKNGIGSPVSGAGGVAPLATVFTPANVATMTSEAQAGSPTQADANGVVVSSSLLNQLQATSPQTYNANTDLVVNGNLTLGGGTSTFNFKSLYVTGNLTLSGNTHTNTTSLYVGGNFNISGPSGTSQFGPIYVGGSVNWNGALNEQTTDYTNSATAPGPMYVGGTFTSAGGPFTDVLGPVYVAGAVNFSGNNASILCPLLVTPANVSTSGSGSFGSTTQPMVLLGLPGATAPMNLSAQGVFIGLLVNMGGGVNLNNSGSAVPPNSYSFFVDGAVMATGDVDFTNNGNVGYSPSVLANLQITAATTSTNVLPGTWQQLSASGN